MSTLQTVAIKHASSSANNITLDTSGNVSVSGTISESSSIRLKENVNPISNALDTLMLLNGVTYDRIDKTAFNQPGFIAEEVYEVLPNIVRTDEDGNPAAINYTKLTAYLLEAVRDLKAELDELKRRVT